MLYFVIGHKFQMSLNFIMNNENITYYETKKISENYVKW